MRKAAARGAAEVGIEDGVNAGETSRGDKAEERQKDEWKEERLGRVKNAAGLHNCHMVGGIS